MQININTDDLANLAERLGQRGTKAQYNMAEQMLKEMTPHVPKREGTLRASGKVSADGKSISWPMIYAHYQYEGVSKLGKTDWHYTNPDNDPNITPHWDKVTMADKTAVAHITKAFKDHF